MRRAHPCARSTIWQLPGEARQWQGKGGQESAGTVIQQPADLGFTTGQHELLELGVKLLNNKKVPALLYNMQLVIIIGLMTREHKLAYNSQVRWHFLRFTRMQHEPEVGFNICIWHYILCLVWLAAGHCTGIGQSKKQTLITITTPTTPPMVKCSYKRRSFFCEPPKVFISNWNWQSSNSKDSLNR